MSLRNSQPALVASSSQLARLSQFSIKEMDPQPLRHSQKSSKSPTVVRVPQSRQGPADVIKVPPTDILLSLNNKKKIEEYVRKGNI
jgi:hypothetical protein